MLGQLFVSEHLDEDAANNAASLEALLLATKRVILIYVDGTVFLLARVVSIFR